MSNLCHFNFVTHTILPIKVEFYGSHKQQKFPDLPIYSIIIIIIVLACSAMACTNNETPYLWYSVCKLSV